MSIQIFIPSSPYLDDPLTNVPLGPLYVAASVRNLGHEVVVTSLLADAISYDDEMMNADLFMIGFSTPQFDEAVKICHYIKRIKSPNAIVIAGGPHPTVRSAETIRAGFDSVIIGEAEGVLKDILAGIGSGSDPEAIYRGDLVHDLDAIPFPSRDLLIESHVRNDEEAVMKRLYSGQGVVSLMCTRGCPYNCAFCSNPVMSRIMRRRSPDNVMDEIAWVIDSLGVTSFKIQDDTFTLDKSYVKELSEASQSRFGDKVTYRLNTRVNCFDEEVAGYLLDMNAVLVAFGFESGSQRVLDNVNKKITIEQSINAAKIAKGMGFDSVIGLMMFGLPGECRETIDEYKDFLTKIRPHVDVMNLATTIPYPGSPIGDNPSSFNCEILSSDYSRYWIVNQDDILLLPDTISSIEEYKALRIELFRHMIKLGWVKEEWKSDAIAWLLEEDNESG